MKRSLPKLAPFHLIAGERAWRETRSIRIFQEHGELPPDEYGLIEFYCPDPKCDCRRVLLQVVCQSQPGAILATVSFGWETEQFYTRWMKSDAQAASNLKGASLDPLGSFHPLAESLLRMVRDTALSDPDYVARLARHYREFKKATRQGLPLPPKT